MECCMCGGKMEVRTLPRLAGPEESPRLESVLQCVDCCVGVAEIEFVVFLGDYDEPSVN